MSKDVLGQEITVGARVLWGSHGGYSGFHGDAPLRVLKVSEKRVTLEIPDAVRNAVVPFGSVVVVDRLLGA